MIESEQEYTTKKGILYSLAGFTDVIFIQFFSFLIFTFYYAVVGLNVNLITIGFIIWSFWNAINDPMLGAISDKTSTKWGRRKPYIIAGIFPLMIVNVLLWTPVMTSELFTFLYFVIIIIVWEFFYTMWNLNQTALFPELFRDLNQRARANTIIQFFQIISLMIAFILPSFFIPKYDDPQYYTNYMLAGIAISAICAVSAILFVKFGFTERIEFSREYEQAPSFFQSLQYTFKNKAFRKYIVATFALWYAFSMIPTITPLYGSFVLGIDDSLILSLLLAIGFVSAAFFVFIWRSILKKYGAKKTYIWVLIVFMITLAPFMFISDIISAFLTFFILGIGLSGALIIRDVTLSAIIDEDELSTGTRREGGFYGIHGFMIKLTNVFVFISIALVFNSVGWAVFDPVGTSQETILGLRSLMFLFPAFFLVLGIIAMLRFPIDKEKYDQLSDQARELHEIKKKKVFEQET
ncbi:MAG: MFS transporter [Candidatus Lokiarchaeota archaeon]|nr:MFS transporter [Candidatus Lokiarchaeota archaeon]MBD3338082.1 MFS transporter [Candidatus Lokiarchaeota archaeon]